MNYIRDTREKVFVMNDAYLNGYARLCGIYATGVYVSLCRHVDKKQSCFPSKKLIAKELAISERAVFTALENLEKWGIIKIEGQGRKSDGSFRNNIYILLDKSVWKPNPQAHSAYGSPQANDDIHRRHTVPNKDTHEEKGTHTSTVASSVEWDLEEKLKDMESKENSHLDVIASFIREKPVVITNSKQLSAVITRYVRIAKTLAGAYTNKQIFATMENIKTDNIKRERMGNDIDWTLETVYKFLTK